MQRIRETDQGLVIDGLTLALICGAAQAYYNDNKDRQDQMGVEEFMAFQVLANTLRDLRADMNG